MKTASSNDNNSYWTVRNSTLLRLQSAFERAGLRVTLEATSAAFDVPTVSITLDRFRWLVRADGTITACPGASTRLRTKVAEVVAVLCA